MDPTFTTLTPTERAKKEANLRRRLHRRGFTLRKSVNRTELAAEFGGYMILEESSGFVVAGLNTYAFTLDIDDVEQFANR
ncbi:MAG: hypothetical protein J0M02_00965 [Planctomycetes bacterium]|nr:hypothetical protein [Planctomycetota bacterium]